MQQIDTLILAAHIAPVIPRDVLDDHAVAVHEGRILALLPREEALSRFDARRVVELDRHLLVPGFVNIHSHAAMALMRGLAESTSHRDGLQRVPLTYGIGSATFVNDLTRGEITNAAGYLAARASGNRARRAATVRREQGIEATQYAF